MKVRTRRLTVFLFLLAFFVITPAAMTQVYSQCGYNSSLPGPFATLNTNKKVYASGEEITLKLSKLKNCNFQVEQIYIQRRYPYSKAVPVVETVYHQYLSHIIAPEKSWTWKWNQLNNRGRQVSPSQYLLTIKTRCCGTYSTNFTISIPLPSDQPCVPSYRPHRACCWPYYGRCWPYFSPSRSQYFPPTQPEVEKPQAKEEKIKAVWYLGWSQDSYLETTVTDDLEQIQSRLCPTHIGIIATIYQNNQSSTDPHRDPQRTVSDETLRQIISQIHRMGRGVILLTPLVSDDGTWEGEILPQEIGTWFDNWGEILTHYAKLAEETGVEVLLVGSQLVTLRTQTEAWEKVINSVRSRYHGKLSYLANFWANRNEYQQVFDMSQWESLDYIGIAGYFELTQSADPSLDTLRAAWQDDRNGQNILEDLERLNDKYKKPIAFWQMGYRSVNGTNIYPWDTLNEGVLDEDEQADAWTAFFDVFMDNEWFKGYGVYTERVGLPKSPKGYTVLEKSVEKVLEEQNCLQE